MRRLDGQPRPALFRLCLIGATALMVGCAGEAPPAAAGDGPFTDADRTAVREAWDALLAAEMDTDWTSVETYLADDFVHMDPRVAGPVSGLENWRAWVEGLDMDLAEGDVSYEVLEIDGSGDLAYVTWTMTGSWTESGEPMTASGKGITVYRRDDDGNWLVARNAWSADPS